MSALWDSLLSYLMFYVPYLVAVIVGLVVFGSYKKRREGQWAVVTLRFASACVSAVVTSAIGVVVLTPLLMWLEGVSAAHPEHDTGTAFGIIALVATWLMAVMLALIVGYGPFRHVRRPGE